LPSIATPSEKSAAPKSSRSTSPAPAPQRNSSPPANASPPPEPAAPAKRVGLRKPETQSRTRAAETPVRTPQYGVQNMQMQQEYTRSSNAPAPSPSRSQPPPNAGPPALAAPVRSSAPAGLQPSPRLVEDQPRGQIPRSARSPDLPHAPQTSLGAPSKHQTYREPPTNLRVDVDLARTAGQPRHEVQRSPEGPYPVPHHRSEVAYRERKSAESEKPRSPHSPHSGIQPGQIFHHPGVQPGQVFSAQRTSPGQPVGQLFSHPSYQSPTQHPQGAPEHHYGHYTELPPGAMPPRSTQQTQQWRAAPPPQPPVQSRSNSQYDYEQAKRSASAGYAPNGPIRDMSSGPRSFSAGDPRSHPQPQYHAPPSPGRSQPGMRHDETPYNPYLRQPVQQNPGYPNERR